MSSLRSSHHNRSAFGSASSLRSQPRLPSVGRSNTASLRSAEATPPRAHNLPVPVTRWHTGTSRLALRTPRGGEACFLDVNTVNVNGGRLHNFLWLFGCVGTTTAPLPQPLEATCPTRISPASSASRPTPTPTAAAAPSASPCSGSTSPPSSPSPPERPTDEHFPA